MSLEISSLEDMNQLLILLHGEWFDASKRNPNDCVAIAKILYEYHLLIAPYVASQHPELFQLLKSLNTIKKNDEFDHAWDQITKLSEGDNTLLLVNLWGMLIDSTTQKEFAFLLLHDEEYNQELLPPILERFRGEASSEVEVIS